MHGLLSSTKVATVLLATTLPVSKSWIALPAHPNPQRHKLRASLLDDCVCLVTGASRGIGKGIALELGAQGATVYITGTTSSAARSSDSTAPNTTIEQTAAEVTKLGGEGIPVVCDHAKDHEVKKLMETIERDHGRLDILVNNAFRLPDQGAAALQLQFWKQGPSAWDPIHSVGLRSHYVATCYAAPLMFRKEASSCPLVRPLIVMISSFGGLAYSFNVAYGVGKAGVDRMAKDMAVDLVDKDVCVVSLWPGLVNTERTKELVASGEWDKFVKIPLENAETPQFTGRAVVALATDANNNVKTGTYQVVAELADEYGFTDVGGKRPPSIRSLRFLLPAYGLSESQREAIPSSLIPDWKLPFWVMAQGKPPA